MARRPASPFLLARVRLGLSGREVAERARCSESTYYRVEAGTRNPSFAVLYRIAVALELNDLVQALGPLLPTSEAA